MEKVTKNDLTINYYPNHMPILIPWLKHMHICKVLKWLVQNCKRSWVLKTPMINVDGWTNRRTNRLELACLSRPAEAGATIKYTYLSLLCLVASEKTFKFYMQYIYAYVLNYSCKYYMAHMISSEMTHSERQYTIPQESGCLLHSGNQILWWQLPHNQGQGHQVQALLVQKR